MTGTRQPELLAETHAPLVRLDKLLQEWFVWSDLAAEAHQLSVEARAARNLARAVDLQLHASDFAALAREMHDAYMATTNRGVGQVGLHMPRCPHPGKCHGCYPGFGSASYGWHRGHAHPR